MAPFAIGGPNTLNSIIVLQRDDGPDTGQIAVFIPAHRAAGVSPAAATVSA